jgi:hypothetical protein
MAVSMKMAAFWDIVLYSLVLMEEAVCTSETLVNFRETKQRNIPEGCQFYYLSK